jgi:hypothetical protein
MDDAGGRFNPNRDAVGQWGRRAAPFHETPDSSFQALDVNHFRIGLWYSNGLRENGRRDEIVRSAAI